MSLVPWLAVCALLASVEAQAKSWCASPLYVHEWGVQVLRTDGAQPQGVPLPSWFHRPPGGVSPSAGEPVRTLPADEGIRTLPVVQWYAPRGGGFPVGLEVGFSQGEASVWWPAVDAHRTAKEARSPASQELHRQILATRAERPGPSERQAHRSKLPPDPSMQLDWERLDLAGPERPKGLTLARAEQPWVERLRAMPQALWVQRGTESDRFVFYEADTTERPSLVLERGETWGPGRQHVILRNVSDWTVHDVVLVAHGRVIMAPAIPAGATAGFLLQDELRPDALLSWLKARWTDPKRADAPTAWNMDMDNCVMMQDPAVPLARAQGHRLYDAEVDLLLEVWAERLAEPDGVHLVYREDIAQLDARMPLSVYTDMFHYPELSRLGVVLVEGMTLP